MSTFNNKPIFFIIFILTPLSTMRCNSCLTKFIVQISSHVIVNVVYILIPMLCGFETRRCESLTVCIKIYCPKFIFRRAKLKASNIGEDCFRSSLSLCSMTRTRRNVAQIIYFKTL